MAVELSKEEQAYLSSKETITFVSQTRYPPFEFVGPDGDHTGMCIELVRWIATQFGFKANFTNMPFKEAQKAVLFGKVDVLTSLFFSEKRDKIFDFTEVMFQVPVSIFVVAERPDIKEINDLKNKTIAMQAGDYALEFLETKNILFEVVYTRNFAEAINLVIAGKADATIGDEQIERNVVLFNEKVKKNGSHHGEVGHVKKDGTTFPTSMTTTLLINEEGEAIGLIGAAGQYIKKPVTFTEFDGNIEEKIGPNICQRLRR